MADAGIYPATSMPDRDWWAALFPDPDWLMRQMGIVPVVTVADLCCGDGYFTASIAAITGGQVHALDLDPALIAPARTELAARGRRRWPGTPPMRSTSRRCCPSLSITC